MDTMTDYEYTVLRFALQQPYDPVLLHSRGFYGYSVVHEQLIRDGYITVETHGGLTASVLTPKGRDALRVTVAA